MSSADLPDDAHVVRYVKPSQFDEGQGVVDASAFRLCKEESGLSVHWLECFENLDKSRQLDEVRRTAVKTENQQEWPIRRTQRGRDKTAYQRATR